MKPQEKARILRPFIEKGSAKLTDTEALEAVELFPHYEIGNRYYKNDRISYNGRLYKVLQAHNSQEDWPPDDTPSLYEEIAKPGQGTIDDPIPYNNNMVLESGKYYIQADIEYLCFRDTEIAVFQDLADLVGLYVEVVD